MKKVVYKCSKNGVELVENFDLSVAEKNSSSVFVVNITTKNREDSFEILKELRIPNSICEKMKTPSDGIRFKYVDGLRYGELAYFSSKDFTSDFASIIIKDNILFAVYKEDEYSVVDFLKSLTNLSDKIEGEIVAEYLLYWLVLEMLSEYGKIIMEARKEIESIAFNLDNEMDKHSLGEISQAKLKLASLEMVLDKLYFTISFPPSKTILNSKSQYSETFNYLLKNVEMLKSYVDQTQDRLDSLSDHYQLVMHERGNKRLNFLTITQAIFVPLTLVVGVYGMNFSYMPELTYKYAYFIVLGGMVFIALLFLVYFKKNGWFD